MKTSTRDKRTVWLAAFGAAVANTVHQECKRGLNVVEAFDPESGGVLDFGSVADYAAAVADAAVICIERDDDRC